MKPLRILLAALAVMALAVPATAEKYDYSGKPPKYVFLFIGDGMASPQRMAATAYTGEELRMDRFPAQGMTTTQAANRFITGSAASATSLASGIKTNINMIGMDPSERRVKTLAEMAKERGMKVGIVSSVSIDHATPAAFYAKVPHRSQYHYVDMQLAGSGFDYFGGGGLKDPTGKRKGVEPKGDALALARKNGFKVVDNKKDFMALKPGQRAIAYNSWLQDSGALPYAMDMRPEDITLPEFTKKGIELLDNDKGFFMMVEGGKIDWACHANDAGAAVSNTIAFDDAVGEAMAFAEKHPGETLIVVTGDHECGGLTLGFAGTKYETDFKVLGGQKVSFTKFDQEVLGPFKKEGGGFEDIKPLITENFGLKFQGDSKADVMVLTDYERAQLIESFHRSMRGQEEHSADPSTYLLYGGYEPLTVTVTHILNNKAGLGWTSYKHTGVPVPISAMGVGADIFNGYYDNTDAAKKLMAVMGIEPKAHYAESSAKTKVAAK
ncbi:alkaline phosphatase [Desulfohalovibrio reitneri]|uniref:alkaline phosphatase n=1 Tax=Desulfohalovibrio reitneri TaxID=1307759 RepID=UPI0004A742D2|nr:alkaline phosphatase [Desulfohalovibrio reitneri]